jgi:hypothetical protein
MNDRDSSQYRLSGSVNLRPTRIGFLVSPSDHRSIRQAILSCRYNHCPLTFLLGRGRPRRLDPRKHNAGGFIVGVLRHQFTPECFGEDGLVEMVD